MGEKRDIKRKTSLAAKIVAAACASCVLAGCIGFGFASAGSGITTATGSFGLDAATSESSQISDTTETISDTSAYKTTALTTTATRDISKGIAAIEAQEEAERIAAEEAKRAEEAERIAAAEAAKAQQAEEALATLSDVDWTVGKDAFLAEWTSRIDAYLAGSPLAGYGAVFAEAAWNNGVDPRFSPAISNTESSKGAACFRSYNAWGWMGSTTWGSWEEAINAHIAGLASGYGYTISVANAQKYCPPTYLDWYGKTLAQMQMI